MFHQILCSGCFPKLWRCANVVPIPKGPLSAFPDGYRAITITLVLSKVFKMLIGARLRRHMELNGFLFFLTLSMPTVQVMAHVMLF